MKKISFIVLALAVSGCATAAPYTNQEYCAERGMKLTGVRSGSVDVNNMIGITQFSSSSEVVQCGVPSTTTEKCDVNRTRQVMTPKREYNSSLTSKKWITGVGYFLWIAPGVVAKLLYDHQESNAIEKSQELDSTIQQCSEKVDQAMAVDTRRVK